MEINKIEKASQDLEVKLQMLEILEPEDSHFKELLQQANELAVEIRTALDFR